MDEHSILKNYRIGEFAKRMGVSPHFLKYYEENGILTPNTQENRYRFYNLWDASVILECKRMKNIGFSVKENRKIMTDSTVAELEQMLLAHEKSLAHELQQKELTLAALHKLRADLRLCQDQEWRICSTTPLWFLPHTCDQNFSSETGVYQQLEDWVNAMPVVRSTHRLTRMQTGVWQSEWGFSVTPKDADALHLQPTPPAVMLPAVKVFEQYINYPVDHSTANEQHEQEYRKIADHIRRLNLVPGNTMLKEVVAYTLKNGIRQVYCILRVPVTEP